MDCSRATPPRVVLLVSPGRLADGARRGGDRRPELVCVSTAYEAAAELLASSADVLVVDLRLLTTGHMPLLDIARRRGAELLGTGPLPWGTSSEQLAGMRLVARGQLAEAILAATDAHGQAKAPAEAAPESAPAAQPPQAEKAAQTGQAGTYEPQRPTEGALPAPQEPLLTPEEISALLGDVE